MWKEYFTNVILERGFNYKDRVDNLFISDDLITAQVLGTHVYDVEIDILEQRVFDMNCSCPYAERDYNCKHMAAVLYLVEDTGSFFKSDEEIIYETIMKSSDDLRKDFLTLLFTYNRDFFYDFRNLVEDNTTENNSELIRDKVVLTLKKHGTFSKNSSKSLVYKYVNMIDDIVNKDINNLIENGFYKDAFDLIGLIILNIMNHKNDFHPDVIERLKEIIDDCSKCMDHIVDISDSVYHHQMMKWFSLNIKDNLSYNARYILLQVLLDVFNKTEYAEMLYKIIDDEIKEYKENNSDLENSIYLEILMIKRVELLISFKADNNQIESYYQEQKDLNYVHVEYVKWLIYTKQYEKALALVEKKLSNLSSDSKYYIEYLEFESYLRILMSTWNA